MRGLPPDLPVLYWVKIDPDMPESTKAFYSEELAEKYMILLGRIARMPGHVLVLMKTGKRVILHETDIVLVDEEEI